MAEKKKLTGRPKSDLAKREKFINVRFTEEEYQLVNDLESELGLSKAELIRMRTLSGAHGVIMNARELIVSLDMIGAELARAGNNINQLARHANTLSLQGRLSPYVTEKANTLLENYINIQHKLEASLRMVIRSVRQ